MKQYYVVAAWIEQRRIKYKLNDGSMRWGPDATEISGFSNTTITYIAHGHIQMIEINTATGGFGANKFLGKAQSAPSSSNHNETYDSSASQTPSKGPSISHGDSLFFKWLKIVVYFFFHPQSSDGVTALIGGISLAVIAGIGLLGLKGYNAASDIISDLTGGTFLSREYSKSDRQKTVNNDEVIEVIGGYVNTITQATNSGNFKKIPNYLDSDSKAYAKQIQQAKKLFRSGVTKEALEIFIQKIFVSQTVIKVNVYEKYKIIYGDRGNKYSDNFYTYHLQKSRPYKIVDIQTGKNRYANSGQKAVMATNTQLCTYPSAHISVISEVQRNDAVRVYTNEILKYQGKYWIKIKHAKYGLGWVEKNTIKINQSAVAPQTKQAHQTVQEKTHTHAKPQQQSASGNSNPAALKPPVNDEERRYQELLKQYNLVPDANDNGNASNSPESDHSAQQPQSEIDTIRRGIVSGINSVDVYSTPSEDRKRRVGYVQKGDTFNVYSKDIRVDSHGTEWIRIGSPVFGVGWTKAEYIKIIN